MKSAKKHSYYTNDNNCIPLETSVLHNSKQQGKQNVQVNLNNIAHCMHENPNDYEKKVLLIKQLFWESLGTIHDRKWIDSLIAYNSGIFNVMQ